MCYPLGVRLWQEVAKGQGEKDKPPKKDVVNKVFMTNSYHMHAAIKKGVCYVNH
jgi:hypothetical protein